ncbi:hypothetical protein PACTADRAFT_74999 [Pachysolen tannophilus NRRL Y-2460]|uniref:Uncharacterized protein n=1 Tax=Pachysolen tannophilus NRRL Y-2460 TaxID=669874 RepID=A0A1E4TVL7_PACTA|nr:hypothetical protein PACTADRAFT_74999 [Pachysolen tannophilus NRRL Y-2460]
MASGGGPNGVNETVCLGEDVAKELDREWDNTVDTYYRYHSETSSANASTNTKADVKVDGKTTIDTDTGNGGGITEEMVNSIFSTLGSREGGDKLGSQFQDEKNLIMSWFWAGYYQGEKITAAKYERIIDNLKKELISKITKGNGNP